MSDVTTEQSAQWTRILCAVLLASGAPVSINTLTDVFDEDDAPTRDQVRALLEEMQANPVMDAVMLVETASGFQFQVAQDLMPWVKKLWTEKPPRYSRAILETLSLIAYRGPITRGEIEDIRGVAVSTHIMKTLEEREWIKVVGHKDVPGKPGLYATTKTFLDYFGLKSLKELPDLPEIKSLDEKASQLEAEATAPVQAALDLPEESANEPQAIVVTEENI